MSNKIRMVHDYMSWIFDLVGRETAERYHYLLNDLYDTIFISLIPMDDNRASDGMDLRYRFAFDRDIPNAAVTNILDIRDSSVLEMMVALAMHCEDIVGEDASDFFWGMIDNLGLGDMTDDGYDKWKVAEIIDNFLNREYEPNGKGGLFITNRDVDMRQVEIWYQMNWYLTDNSMEE